MPFQNLLVRETPATLYLDKELVFQKPKTTNSNTALKETLRADDTSLRAGGGVRAEARVFILRMCL